MHALPDRAGKGNNSEPTLHRLSCKLLTSAIGIAREPNLEGSCRVSIRSGRSMVGQKVGEGLLHSKTVLQAWRRPDHHCG